MTDNQAMLMRGVNFWPHIRNWYEVHSLQDNKQLLDDIAGMGFNDFCTCFERELLRNYLDERTADDYGRRLWRTLQELGRAAHDLGLKVTIIDALNTVFTDQCGDPALADVQAEKPPTWPRGWQKKDYLFCPSKPRAREIILRNHELAYKQYPFIDAVLLWAYDPSGCGCADCHPWPKTALELGRELAHILRTYHPQAAVYLSAWDMSDEEVGILSDLLNQDSSGTFQGVVDKEWLLLNLETGGEPSKRWAGLAPRYIRMPYIDLCQIGAWGWHCFTANPHPVRFETLFRAMRRAGIVHYSAYSEDVHDDINKYFIARLGLSPEKSARELIHEYCMRYFQAAVGDDVYEAACLMEDEYTHKLGSPWVQKPIPSLDVARRMHSILKNVEARLPQYIVQTWRWQALMIRAELSLIINEIGDLDETKTKIEEQLRAVLAAKTAEAAHDELQKAALMISDKQQLLARLRATVDSFRSDVLQEPFTRTIRVHSALPSYYAWQKMLVEMDETVGLATRIFLNSMQDVIRERLHLSESPAAAGD